MRLFISLSVAALLAVALLTACNSTDRNHPAGNTTASANPSGGNQPNAAPSVPGDGVKRITTVELKRALDKGDAVVVDVRGETAWEAGHIKGARWMQTSDLLGKADQLPRDKMIVTYCS